MFPIRHNQNFGAYTCFASLSKQMDSSNLDCWSFLHVTTRRTYKTTGSFSFGDIYQPFHPRNPTPLLRSVFILLNGHAHTNIMWMRR